MEEVKQKKRNMMSYDGLVVNDTYIPYSLFVDILVRLPIKSILRFKSVCKYWRLLFQDPHFIKLYYNRSKAHTETFSCLFAVQNIGTNSSHQCFYSINREGATTPIEMNGLLGCELPIAHCNGLLCFSWLCTKTICVYNPSTREHIELPNSSYSRSSIGFGFSPSTNKYIVVQNLNHLGGSLIFTLGTGSWRRISSRPVSYDFNGASFFYKGGLYWNENGQIISFNLEMEKFGVIPHPDDISNSDGKNREFLHEFQGFLCIFSGPDDEDIFNLWSLTDQNNHCWVRQSFSLSLNVPRYTMPRVATRIGEMWTVSCSDSGQFYLHCYNPQSRLSKKIELLGLPSDGHDYWIGYYVDNPVSLRNG